MSDAPDVTGAAAGGTTGRLGLPATVARAVGGAGIVSGTLAVRIIAVIDSIAIPVGVAVQTRTGV